MAFMRHPFYILMQDGRVTINGSNGDPNPYFSLGQELFDEIVMMRFYNMTEDERTEAVCRALENQFETGADGIRAAHGLTTVMERVAQEVVKENIEDWNST